MRADRRRHPRLDLGPQQGWQVRLQPQAAEALYGALVNLSLGGLCARLDHGPPVPGTGCSLTVGLPGRRPATVSRFPGRLVRCWAEVAGRFVGVTFVLPEGPEGEPGRTELAQLLDDLSGGQLL